MRTTRESRPGGRSQAAEISSANQIEINDTDSDAVVRCRRCRHPLTSQKSVERELGPVCVHLEKGVASC